MTADGIDAPPPVPDEWRRPPRLDLCPGCAATVSAPDAETEIPHGYRSEYTCDGCGHAGVTCWLVEWPENLPYIGSEGALL